MRWTAPFALGIVAALVAVSLYAAMQPRPHVLDQSDVNKSIAGVLASQTPAPPLSQQVYQAVAPSLVLVEAQLAPSAGGASRATAMPGGLAPVATGAPQADTSLGSGVIVDDGGDILTALHVVADSTAIQVTFADGTVSPATIAWQQPANDIAVLKPAKAPSSFRPAVLGNPRSVQVGSEAFVLGNPFGLDDSLTAGVISGLDRSFHRDSGPDLTGLIQIDAAVNPGNSGGPLVNRAGQVVGIVTALINPTKQDVFIGIGLAVPIDVATRGGPAQLPQY